MIASQTVPMVDPSVYPYYERLNQNPEDAEALLVLWQWHGDRGEFQQLATLAEQVASRRMDPSSAADLFFRAGELWAKNVGRHDKAVGNYRRAYEMDANQVQAIEAARTSVMIGPPGRSSCQTRPSRMPWPATVSDVAPVTSINSSITIAAAGKMPTRSGLIPGI